MTSSETGTAAAAEPPTRGARFGPAAALLSLVACGPRPAPTNATLLARHPEKVAALDLPQTAWPTGHAATGPIPLMGAQELRRDQRTVQYSFPLPIRQVFLGHSPNRTPPGMSLQGPTGRKLSFHHINEDEKLRARTWELGRDRVHLSLDAAEGAPEDGAYTLHYDSAHADDARLDPSASGLAPLDFALASLPLGDSVYTGLLLPAPAKVVYDLDLPRNAHLRFRATFAEPVIDQATATDGATLRITVHADGQATEVYSQALSPSVRPSVTLNLSRWQGQSVQLEIRTEPGLEPWYDYVFLEEPLVHTPTTKPRRLLIVLVDTLRADRLGLYGNDRDTSPNIDALGAQGVVFEAARAPSPWTLPSTRALLSGQHPESWDPTDHLGARLAKAGWVTGAFSANPYLTQSFDMARGWSKHRYFFIASAKRQVDRAKGFLAENADRDVALLVHFMDPHTPYQEPEPYLERWSGPRPADMPDEISIGTLRSLKFTDADHKARVQAYLRGRYDQNVRYVDDQLGSLLEMFDDDAVIAVVSDHGEEFFEHGSFEHGHTLYEEVVHVPFVLKAPGMPPRRVDTPVSLLDLAPTLAELLDLPPADTDGLSLVALAHGEGSPELRSRPIAMGRPLYGRSKWGVVSGGHKWIAADGAQRLYDLDVDPAEQRDLAATVDLGPYHQALATALDRELALAYRIEYPGTERASSLPGAVTTLTVPGGVIAAWGNADPLGRDIAPEVDGDRVLSQRSVEARVSGEVFVLPRDPAQSLAGLSLSVRLMSRVYEDQLDADASIPLPGPNAELLLEAGPSMRKVRVGRAMVPLPKDSDRKDSIDERVHAELESLGYLE